METDSGYVHSLSHKSPVRALLVVLLLSVIAGLGTGYLLASDKSQNGGNAITDLNQKAPETASQDNRTFRDFAEGKITKKPDPKPGQNYTEGTHMLIRDGAVPVALTSSVVDLSTYENKKVKVYGETQKAISEGWLMDVGKVEEIN